MSKNIAYNCDGCGRLEQVVPDSDDDDCFLDGDNLPDGWFTVTGSARHRRKRGVATSMGAERRFTIYACCIGHLTRAFEIAAERFSK